jgi:hypothetical protein
MIGALEGFEPYQLSSKCTSKGKVAASESLSLGPLFLSVKEK